MSYTDLRDFAAEYTYQADSGLTVQVEKLGGGTVGEKYVGLWRYIVTDSKGAELGRGQDMESGLPHGHRSAARIVAEYFAPAESAPLKLTRFAQAVVDAAPKDGE